ncbi:restriction endonuclease [Flavobacterium plurextorum]|uniref:restriction endonuclease n=1 Tax=Flavobacterium TaxID=237 RepID=UPI00214DE8D6|nr:MULTISPECIES: restriction endonuclease [Flavobacterium]UUW08296.1 restriction endonuclease [Flavobacterium plurextorum]
MTLKSISREKFDNYDFMRFSTFSAKEYYWFADDDANIIGSVLLDNYDKDWSYIILAKEEDGTYALADIAVSIEMEENAVEKLTQKMIEYAEIGKIEKNLYHSNLFDPKSSIIITEMDDVVKKYFKSHPEKMYEMNPRKFEELIAAIFKDLGYAVELTKATRDGGRDIIASISTAATNFLAYVECKRYAPDRKVDVGIIRDVAGVQYIHKPSKSIIVTTGYFTKDAIETAKQIENQLDLKDFSDIKTWLEKY